MKFRTSNRHAWLAGAALATVLSATAFAAQPGEVSFRIPAGDMGAALSAYAKQSGVELFYQSKVVAGRKSAGLDGAFTPQEGLDHLVAGTGLVVARDQSGAYLIRPADAAPQGDSAGGGAESNVVQELIVTAQKKEEAIQTVPIAISAFTQKSLEEQHIEGGFDLLKAIPNVTFSKNNFTSYNFSIRGIGTKAISATTDPGVAVAFNNTALIQNRLFEQEYFDVERVEVLRGPQGTLYGRNATAGVINVISAKPSDHFEGSIKAEIGNYQSRRASGMLNIPIFGDKLAVRLAGSFTQREGYDYNSVTHNAVNGRDLWSGRLTVGFKPFERLHGNFIWEHFDENDNRSRTGKQLCHRDPGLQSIGSTPTVDDPSRPMDVLLRPALFSQGCKPGSLYNDDAFGTPNGLALPFVFGMLALGGDCSSTGQVNCSVLFPLGRDANGRVQTLLQLKDPYGGMMQSRDLRTIASFRDPRYRANADVVELNLDIDVADNLTLSSQTAYNKDTVYSFQDFNRFNTVPVFTDTSQLYQSVNFVPGTGQDGVTPAVVESVGPQSYWANLAPGGIFCDPQLGCSNTLAGFDISQAKGRQFTQEIRLQSSFDGPLNFSVGANYTRFQALVDYYVMYNLITAFALMPPFNGGRFNPGPDITKCHLGGALGQINGPLDINDPRGLCPYVDPNPVESINGEGHNYFRSKNPYKLKSAAAFGEVYWNITDALKLTAGLRYTDDRKTFIPVPSQILLAQGVYAGGVVNRGYPEDPPIKQHWGEVTGRLGLDWKPQLSFTDQTMVYAFYSHGYKGGGANPPSPGFATIDDYYEYFTRSGLTRQMVDAFVQFGYLPVLQLTAAEYGRTFRPEFVNAFEVGTKNTLMGGALVFNANAFFYDYKDYQVSQIRDRTAVNENFNAKVWGTEFETVFSPTRNLRIVANLGYLDTRIGDGMKSIDIMNRTQGDPNYVVVKSWAQLPSNCVVPVGVAESWLTEQRAVNSYWSMCGGLRGLLSGAYRPTDPATGQRYNEANYPELNGGAGILDDLSGNKLPNAPHWTSNIGVQYGVDFLEGWRATIRADAYWQSQSWARVYNSDPYDKLHGWYNMNLSLWVEKPDIGLKIEIYAKNVLDKTPITDAFLNSDDTALTTNVFTLDPRLIGFSITKTF